MSIDLGALAGLSLDELEKTLTAAVEHKRANLLDFWQPYPKQLEFIALGKAKRERLLMAGNRLGKSDCGAYELAAHLTGLYPKDWPGKRYIGPNDWWAAGTTAQAVRDVQQAKLCGVFGQIGTGFIPKRCFSGKPSASRSVADAFDTVRVYHHNTDGIRDGISTLQFKAYKQEREAFQGANLTGGVWWDEEPPEDIYVEGNARWSSTDGMSLMTFTPLKGLSTVVLHYLEDRTGRTGVVQFRVSECPHFTPELIADAKAKYPPHEWEARLEGEPFKSAGRVFRTDERFITFPVGQKIMGHWALLWGIDFGITHPFAAVLGAWDRDADVVYLIRTYRAADALPIVHAEAIRREAAAVPVAWPHDGHAREKGSGEQLSTVYKALGLNMLPNHSTFPVGGFSTETAVMEMQQRFASGQLKVREDLADFLGEYRQYHRDDNGLLVKVRDDLLSATMKIIMMKRFAKTVPLGYAARRDPNRVREPEFARDIDFDLFA